MAAPTRVVRAQEAESPGGWRAKKGEPHPARRQRATPPWRIDLWWTPVLEVQSPRLQDVATNEPSRQDPSGAPLPRKQSKMTTTMMTKKRTKMRTWSKEEEERMGQTNPSALPRARGRRLVRLRAPQLESTVGAGGPPPRVGVVG